MIAETRNPRTRTPRSRLPAALAAALLAVAVPWAAPAGAAEHRVGIGANYWRTLDDLADEDFDIEDSGVAPVLSYQLVPAGLLRFEIDLEYFDEGFGGAASEALSPQVYALVGRGLYGGVGVGVTFSDDFQDNVSDPFYAARLGWNLTLLPRVHLDVYANYRFDAWGELDEADTDTVFLGAAVRLGF